LSEEGLLMIKIKGVMIRILTNNSLKISFLALLLQVVGISDKM